MTREENLLYRRQCPYDAIAATDENGEASVQITHRIQYI